MPKPTAEEKPVPVIFRKYRQGEIVAMLPTVPGTADPCTCANYMHVGQHGHASELLMIAHTEPATEREYAPLLAELQAEPYRYRLRVVKRTHPNYYRARCAALEYTRRHPIAAD